MRITYRIHEWLADRFKWVQYPRLQPLAQRRRPIFMFETQMPILQRLLLIQWGVLMLLFSLAALAFGLFVAYVLIKVLISS